MKSATQFSARREITSIYFANTVNNTFASYSWIDNTAEVWPKLREVLEEHDPASNVVSVDADVASSPGLHTVESMEFTKQRGPPRTYG